MPFQGLPSGREVSARVGLQQDQEGLPGDENEFEAEGADGPVVAEVQEGKVRGSINYVIKGKLYR